MRLFRIIFNHCVIPSLGNILFIVFPSSAETEAIEAVEAVTAKMVANTSNDINGDIKLGAETISLASSTATTAAASTTTASEAVEDDEDITSDLTSLNDAV